MNSTTATQTITVNGVTGTREVVVLPLRTNGSKTLVSFIQGASVSTKWVSTNRIKAV